jgi:endonuclease/exonuclease/phosphatase family metal-dependent hydrolase
MLQVMTLNLNYYHEKHGTWPARRALICQSIKSLGPDVIALQAVESDPAHEDGIDQATQLAQLIPEYHYVHFEPAQRTQKGGTQGSAFLGRIRIAESNCLALSKIPGLEDPKNRIVLAGTFDLATGPIQIFNAHLSWVDEQAQANIAEAVHFVNAFDSRGLVVGDFNNPPGARVFGPLKSSGWIDVWEDSNAKGDGFTFESDHPYVRFDYAWVNHQARPYVRSIRVVADQENGSGTRCSSHFGLLVAIDLKVQ